MTVLPHTRLTLSGVYGSPTVPIEIWSINLNFNRVAGLSTVAGLTTFAAAARSAWGTHISPLYDTDVRMTKVRAANVEGNGKVERLASGAYVQGDDLGDTPGTTGAVAANRKPLQTALVVSLLTARPGAAGKGRIFLPWPNPHVLDTDYRISTTSQTNLSTQVRAFLLALNTASSSNVVVVGGTSAITGKSATITAVDAIRIGRVPDTMRSRRSAMLESYNRLAL